MPLLAVLVDDVGQLALADLAQAIGRGRPLAAVHPHVERGVAAEAEAALDRVELHRRHAEIGEHAVDGGDAARVEHGAEITIVGVRDVHAIAVGVEPLTRHGNGLRVAIDGDHARRPALEQRLRVPAQSQGAVHEHAAPRRLQPAQRLGHHHRRMTRHGRLQIPNSDRRSWSVAVSFSASA